MMQAWLGRKAWETEWSDELWDSSQDIYTLEDGEAVNAPR